MEQHAWKRLRRPAASERVLVILRGAPRTLAEFAPSAAAADALVGGAAVLVAAFARRGRMGRFLTRDRLAWLVRGERIDADAPREVRHEAGRFSVELTVRQGEDVELDLVAEACARPEGSLFTSTRDAAAYLARFANLAPEPGSAWEPVAPTRVDWSVPGLTREVQGALAFDSAFRQVRTRLWHAPRASVRSVLAADGARPMPAP